MLLKAYSIYDRKALQYHAPFFSTADAAAVRSLTDLANDTSTTVGRHPDDYVLYCVGTFDDASGGLLSGGVPPAHVVDAITLVRHQPSLFPASAPLSG